MVSPLQWTDRGALAVTWWGRGTRTSPDVERVLGCKVKCTTLAHQCQDNWRRLLPHLGVGEGGRRL